MNGVDAASERLTRALEGSGLCPHCGVNGEGFPKGSKKAIAAMKRARKAQPAMHHPSTGKTNTRRFVKGSDEAREFMSQLRDAKHHKRAAAIEKDKVDFWDEDTPAPSRRKAAPKGRAPVSKGVDFGDADEEDIHEWSARQRKAEGSGVGGAVRGRLVKGSQEAKDHMARLRAMRR